MMMDGVLKDLGGGVFVYTRELVGLGGSVNGSLFLFPDCALVVDTLCSPEDMAAFSDLARGRKVTVVYTHADWDHCLGTAAFCGSNVVAHQRAADRLRDRGEEDLSRILLTSPELSKGASITLPDVTFQDRFASGRVEVSHLPGHTEDSCVVWVSSTGVLAAGDAVEDALPSIGDLGYLGQWIKSLREWAQVASLVIPGHGEPQGPEICQRNADYLEAVMNCARRNTPYGRRVPDTSLESLAPETAARLDRMTSGERRFYREVHRDNVRRVLELVGPDVQA